MSENWIERAQSWEAKYTTLKAQIDPMKERVQAFKSNFGVRERQNGEIVIDFEKMVERLGAEACLELRKEIDRQWNISGAPGEKPKIRVQSA